MPDEQSADSKWRSHQVQLDLMLRDPGGTLDTVIASVTPGGGKSALPVIASHHLLSTFRAHKICWVVPRLALAQQAERAFMDARFRGLLGHGMQIRAACNEATHPSGGLAGYVTTYHAIKAAPNLHADEFRRHRYILVLDEPHHVVDGGEWHQAILPLYERAAFRLLMSGTLGRSDNKPIAFLPYGESVSGRTPVDMNSTAERAVITYSRREALGQKAIVPVHFDFLDGEARWVNRDGEEKSVESLAGAGEDTAAAVFTALNEKYAEELLSAAVQRWSAYRKAHEADVKLLVVAPNIGLARKYLRVVKSQGVSDADIATSDESERALSNIERLKGLAKPNLDALVTVAMAYEGLDCPSIKFIACLTHIRSKPWIEQLVARATRFDPKAGAYDRQQAMVFAPDDAMFRECVKEMQEDQDAFIRESPRQPVEPPNGGTSEPPVPIIPLGARHTSTRAGDLDGEAVDANDYDELVAWGFRAGVPHLSVLQLKRLKETMEAQRTEPEVSPSAREVPSGIERTPSQQEAYLRSELDRVIKEECAGAGGQFSERIRAINTVLIKRYNKQRAEMTLHDLQHAWDDRAVWLAQWRSR